MSAPISRYSRPLRRTLRSCLYSRQYSTPSSPTTACSPGPSKSLSPLRYHIFTEPLPYPIGLKLQHDIINRRLKLKSDGMGSDDIVLFLG